MAEQGYTPTYEDVMARRQAQEASQDPSVSEPAQQGYTPTYEDVMARKSSGQQAQGEQAPTIQQSAQQNPMLLALARKISEHPSVSKALGSFVHEQDPFIKNLSRGVEGAQLPEASGGFTQGGYDALKNVVNLPGHLLGQKNVMDNRDLSKYLNTDEYGKRLFNVGNFLGDIGSIVAPTSMIGNLGKLNLPGRMATGAGLGYAESENRPLGAAIGAGGSLVEPLFAARSKPIVKNIFGKRKIAKSISSENYNDIFNRSEKLGINQLAAKPKMNAEALKNLGTKKDLIPVSKFMENPTIRNAHEAQSELGRLQRKIEALQIKDKSSGAQNVARDAANDAIKNIRESMKYTWESKGSPHLSKSYKNATTFHKEQVVPLDGPPIRKAEKELSDALKSRKNVRKKTKAISKDLVSDLQKDKEFMRKQGIDDFPDLRLNKSLSKIGGKAADKAALAAALAASGFAGLGQYNKFIK